MSELRSSLYRRVAGALRRESDERVEGAGEADGATLHGGREADDHRGGTVQPGSTVSEVLRRHQLEATRFYRWEREARAAMREALSGKPRGGGGRLRELEREILQLQAELERKRRVISEVVEENLSLKRGL